jgi:hypothetical protein
MTLAVRIATVISLAGLTSCASIVSGSYQTVTVQTGAAGSPVDNANCQLQNGRGTWDVTSPGSVSVHRDASELAVTCLKKGYGEGDTQVLSGTNNWVWGNIGFGGIIGVLVDSTDGAADRYPSTVRVPMQPAPVASMPAPAKS